MAKTAKKHEITEFVLESPRPTKRKRTKQEARAEKLLKKKLLETKRQEREFQKEQQKQKENARKQGVKPIFVKKVSHKPTYCTVGSYIINKEDLPNYENSIPPTFTVKNDIQSSKSLCRLKNAVNWMLLFADKKTVKAKHDKAKAHSKENSFTWSFRLAFHTLTLPGQNHSDAFIKEHMLQPYLYWLQRMWNCSYVWKAETQINGNIHFHITVDQYVPKLKMIRKWNQILRVYGYLTMEESTNTTGRAQATTQVKAVLNEKKCAKDIADYVAKKDKLPTVVARGFEAIWKGEVNCTKEIKACFKYLRYGKEAQEAQMFSTVAAAAASAQLHCSYDPDTKKGNPGLLKRVVDGRLWGCSSELSNINISIEEGDAYVQDTDLLDHEEKIFFRQNPDIYNLGKTLIKRKKIEAAKKSEPERVVLCITDEDIERKFEIFKNVWIHPHLSVMKKGSHLQKLLHEQKIKGKFNKQKYFIEN